MATISQRKVLTPDELQNEIADTMSRNDLRITINLKDTEEKVRKVLKENGIEASDEEVRRAMIKVFSGSFVRVLSTNYVMPPTSLRDDLFTARVCFQKVNKS